MQTNIHTILLVHLQICCQPWSSVLLSESVFVLCSRQISAHPGLERLLPEWKKSHLLRPFIDTIEAIYHILVLLKIFSF